VTHGTSALMSRDLPTFIDSSASKAMISLDALEPYRVLARKCTNSNAPTGGLCSLPPNGQAAGCLY